jgi:HEAT repeats
MYPCDPLRATDQPAQPRERMSPNCGLGWWNWFVPSGIVVGICVASVSISLARPIPTAAELLTELSAVPEIGLHTFSADMGTFDRTAIAHPALALFDSRSDLGHLPLIRKENCELDPASARVLRRGSMQLREALGGITSGHRVRRNGRCDSTGPDDHETTVTRAAQEWPGLLVWMLQAEGEPHRKLLIDVLAKSSGAAATNALVGRALFDPDPNLRREATMALKGRPAENARPLLLAALQYPWAPAADHAATALIAFGDKSAVPDLAKLLDAPNPAGPYLGADGQIRRRDMIRINHARNCQLCHAPSTETRDFVRAPVPSPDLPLPPSFARTVSNYYDSHPRASPGVRYVRAEVTYLRPDFSISLPVENPGRWPKMQRYDFIVRTRPAQTWETASTDQSYPQRESVLRALRTLTGLDYGNRTEDWRPGLRKAARFADSFSVADARQP